MITLNTTETINQAEFDKVYADSISAMENKSNGTWPWEGFLTINTPEEKKQYIQKVFNKKGPNDLLIEIRDDSLLLALFLGQWIGEELVITAVLVSPDSTGTKAWTYSEEYANARNAFWDSIDIDGWTHRSSGEHSATHKYLLKCNEIGTLKASYEVNLVDHQEIPANLSNYIKELDYQMVDVKLRKL